METLSKQSSARVRGSYFQEQVITIRFVIGVFRGGAEGRPPLFSCIFKTFLKRQRYFIATCLEK